MIKNTVASTKIKGKMEQETLFTASKWEILKLLSSGSKSPLELARLSNTSVANISQQLRLLEMAGLVHSQRISNRDKGQPRLLYSLAGNHSFLITSTPDFVEKKLLRISDYNKIILRIWFLQDASLHYYLEKAFWKLEEYINNIDGIFFMPEEGSDECLNFLLVSENNELKKILKKEVIKNPDGIARTVLFNFKTKSEFKKLSESQLAGLYKLYDPTNLLNQKNNEGRKSNTKTS